MPQDLPEQISEHVSVVQVGRPPPLPHCADISLQPDFGDRHVVHVRACLPLKHVGAQTTVLLLGDENAIAPQAMNFLLRSQSDLQ